MMMVDHDAFFLKGDEHLAKEKKMRQPLPGIMRMKRVLETEIATG